MILVCFVLALLVESAGAEVFLPGMQPQEAGIEFVKVQQCKMCHGGTDNGDADPFQSWQTGLMSISAKNPLFRAALAVANQDVEGIGEFCLRCHGNPAGAGISGNLRIESRDIILISRSFGANCWPTH